MVRWWGGKVVGWWGGRVLGGGVVGWWGGRLVRCYIGKLVQYALKVLVCMCASEMTSC